jgi:hypothetical protein
MAAKERDARREVVDELVRLHKELKAIDKWDRLFASTELNGDSYLARQRRRWEILLRLKALEAEASQSQHDCS